MPGLRSAPGQARKRVDSQHGPWLLEQREPGHALIHLPWARLAQPGEGSLVEAGRQGRRAALHVASPQEGAIRAAGQRRVDEGTAGSP